MMLALFTFGLASALSATVVVAVFGRAMRRDAAVGDDAIHAQPAGDV